MVENKASNGAFRLEQGHRGSFLDPLFSASFSPLIPVLRLILEFYAFIGRTFEGHMYNSYGENTF